MKTATFPPLRVDPALRRAAEDVLHEGETLSAFVEASVRAQVGKRQMQEEFLKRGLAGLAQAERSGVYHTVDEVMGELRTKLQEARQPTKPKAKARRT